MTTDSCHDAQDHSADEPRLEGLGDVPALPDPVAVDAPDPGDPPDVFGAPEVPEAEVDFGDEADEVPEHPDVADVEDTPADDETAGGDTNVESAATAEEPAVGTATEPPSPTSLSVVPAPPANERAGEAVQKLEETIAYANQVLLELRQINPSPLQVVPDDDTGEEGPHGTPAEVGRANNVLEELARADNPDENSAEALDRADPDDVIARLDQSRDVPEGVGPHGVAAEVADPRAAANWSPHGNAEVAVEGYNPIADTMERALNPPEVNDHDEVQRVAETQV